MNVRNALSSKDNKVVLNACIVGEKAAVKGYDAVLKNNELPPETRAVLNDQRRNIEEALDEVEGLFEMIES